MDLRRPPHRPTVRPRRSCSCRGRSALLRRGRGRPAGASAMTPTGSTSASATGCSGADRGPPTSPAGSAEWPGFLAGFLDRHGITDLVLIGEQRPYHRPAIAVAQARGIAVDGDRLRLPPARLGGAGTRRHGRRKAASRATPRRSWRWRATCPAPDLAAHHRDSFATQAPLGRALPPGLAAALALPALPELPAASAGAGLSRHRAAAAAARRETPRRRRATLAALRAGGAPLFLFAMQMETDYLHPRLFPLPRHGQRHRRGHGSFARAAPPDARLLVKVHPLDPGLKRWRDASAGSRRRRRGGRVHYLGGALPMEPITVPAAGGGDGQQHPRRAGDRWAGGDPGAGPGDLRGAGAGWHGGPLDDFWTEGRRPTRPWPRPSSVPSPPACTCAAATMPGRGWTSR